MQIKLLNPKTNGPFGKGNTHWLYYIEFGVSDIKNNKPIEGLFGVIVCSPDYFNEPDPNEPVDGSDKYIIQTTFDHDEAMQYVESIVNDINGQNYSSWEPVTNKLKQHFYLDD